MSEAIIVASIGMVGAVLAALIQTTRKENKDDHATVLSGMQRIEGKIDTHINDHARQQMK